jgi:superfamily I DNA/RNA helicase/serine/threonine protein kinase
VKATSPRWHQVTESAYAHEQRALDHVRELLPDEAPWSAWANFTFVARDGRHREVDLLVAAPNGLHLIEIKNWQGHLTNEGRHWSRGGRPEKSPLDLTVQKSKELADYLQVEARRVDVRMQVPFVEAAVFLAEPAMRSSLDGYQRHRVYAPADAVNDLPRLADDLLFAPAQRRQPDPRFLDALPQLLRRIGISAAAPSRMVGPWRLEAKPYDEGPTWQDFHATRTDVAGNPHRRIRIYLEAKLTDEDARRSVRSAAEREFRAAAGIHHPGLLAPADLDEHELGPALIIEQEPDAERLEHWLIRHGDHLTPTARVGLVRQLASAVAYAHRKRLVHRALAPRAVIVESGPTLRVGEWQVASRGQSSSRSRHRAAPTSMSADHLDPTVEPYLAPEFSSEGADGTVDLDVFGVGAIAYLILTGEPPAASRAELRDRLLAEGGLDPRTGTTALDALVREATHPVVTERTPSVDDIRESLDAILRPRRPEKDPLDAVAGDVLPGGYRVERVLGTGSSARALLVRRDGLESVLKVGSSTHADRLLSAEAASLEDLRHDNIVVLRRGTFPIADRHAIELSNAGGITLADVLATDGPLRGDELRSAGDQLLAAVSYLAARGTRHRDVKPANVGVHDDGTSRRVVLFDFSLGLAPDDDIQSGTRDYLDPLLGSGDRTAYDDAAELYAVAATLHELASGKVPRWGYDGTAATFVPEPTLGEASFDPAFREALATFFRRALAKDLSNRYASVDDLRDAWNAIFVAAPSTVHRTRVQALDVHVDVVAHLRGLAVAPQQSTVDALETACSPAPHLVAPVGARDDRMRLLPMGQDLSGVVLVPEGAERGLLLRLMSPEAASAWARAHTASVNEASGALEFRDAVALDDLVAELGSAEPPTDGPFDHVSDDDLASLGLDPRMIAYARVVPTVDVLVAAQPWLPEEQYGVLLALARGQSLDEVRTTLVAPRRADAPVDPGDLGAAVERSAGKIAMLEDLTQLRELLDRPISHFRTFLHPSQEKLAYRSNWGSFQVTGGPGTGKTVVGLHRVKHLVERREVNAGKVLLTTFTKGLAAVLERDLRQMIDAERMPAVQVVNVDRWAYGIVREHLGTKNLPIVKNDDAEARWRRIAAEAGVSKSPAFLQAEWVDVVLAQGLTDEESYVSCERRGRGQRLGAAQRRPVWQAIAAYAGSLRADGLWTHHLIADEAARLLGESGPPFDHIVVDEIQDLHPTQWRLLRAAVKRKPEDLFLTGDPHQRIYGHRVSLKSVDVDISGRRSAKLTLSYRTSAGILQWALAMLGSTEELGLDGVPDDLAAYRSAFSGAPPEIVGAESRDEELAGLVEAVQEWHARGIDWEDIAVVARGQHVWRPAASALRRADVPVVELAKAAGPDAIRIGSMHGLKGLEFRAVAVIGVRDGVVPRPNITPRSEDEVVHRNEMQDERNLLFVAATRPRERLRVSWHGEPSPFLGPRPSEDSVTYPMRYQPGRPEIQQSPNQDED